MRIVFQGNCLNNEHKLVKRNCILEYDGPLINYVCEHMNQCECVNNLVIIEISK